MVYHHHFRLNINGLENQYILMLVYEHSIGVIQIDFWHLFCVKFSSLEHASGY